MMSSVFLHLSTGSGRDMCQKVFNEKDTPNPKPGELGLWQFLYIVFYCAYISISSLYQLAFWGLIRVRKALTFLQHRENAQERLALRWFLIFFYSWVSCCFLSNFHYFECSDICWNVKNILENAWQSQRAEEKSILHPAYLSPIEATENTGMNLRRVRYRLRL
jgi:hypothetical protein